MFRLRKNSLSAGDGFEPALKLDLKNRHPPPHRPHPNPQSLLQVPPVKASRLESTFPKKQNGSDGQHVSEKIVAAGG